MSTPTVLLQPDTPEELRGCFERLRHAQRALAQVPLDGILQRLDALGRLWQPGAVYERQARTLLAGTFSPWAVAAALQGLALSLNARMLRAEVGRELGRADLLDTWQPDEAGVGHVRGFPLGVVAQVLAGNVFLGGVVALAQALLTRNAVLLKLSHKDSGFTEVFAQSLHDVDDDGVLTRALAVATWPSAAEELNQVVRDEADAVVVWGSQAAVAAYPAARCRGRVIAYGPRLGIGVLLASGDLETALAALAWDVALWEQQACSSPRLLFVEDVGGCGELPARAAAGLSRALAQVRDRLEPRPLTLDEKAEVLSLRELAYWSDQARVWAEPQTLDHTVLLTTALPAQLPVGYRTVTLVPLADLADLPAKLLPFRDGLQTAALAAPRPSRWPDAVAVLARAGLAQVNAAGSAAARFLGLPHEGEFALRRLVRLVGVDLGMGPLTYPNRGDDAAAIAAALAGSQ